MLMISIHFVVQKPLAMPSQSGDMLGPWRFSRCSGVHKKTKKCPSVKAPFLERAQNNGGGGRGHGFIDFPRVNIPNQPIVIFVVSQVYVLQK